MLKPLAIDGIIIQVKMPVKVFCGVNSYLSPEVIFSNIKDGVDISREIKKLKNIVNKYTYIHQLSRTVNSAKVIFYFFPCFV